MTATEFQLKLIDWQFFGTLTWSQAHLGSARSREQQLWQFFRVWAIEEHMRLYNFLMVVRWERGELGDRPHSHFLLAGLPASSVNITQCMKRMALWDKQFGFARIRLFQSYRHHSGVLASYVTKSRSHDANTYEMSKFDRADRLVIGTSAWNKMLEISGAERVAQAHTN